MSRRIFAVLVIMALCVVSLPISAIAQEGSFSIVISEDNLVTPKSIPAKYSWSKKFSVKSSELPSGANFTLTVSGTIDVQNDYVVSIKTSLKKTSSLNLKSNRLKASAVRSGTNIYVMLSGEIDWEWTDPKTNSHWEATTEHAFGETFDPDDYIYEAGR